MDNIMTWTRGIYDISKTDDIKWGFLSSTLLLYGIPPLSLLRVNHLFRQQLSPQWILTRKCIAQIQAWSNAVAMRYLTIVCHGKRTGIIVTEWKHGSHDWIFMFSTDLSLVGASWRALKRYAIQARKHLKIWYLFRPITNLDHNVYHIWLGWNLGALICEIKLLNLRSLCCYTFRSFLHTYFSHTTSMLASDFKKYSYVWHGIALKWWWCHCLQNVFQWNRCACRLNGYRPLMNTLPCVTIAH